MSYSKVSGRYFYGNGDFYHFEGYITDLWGGGNYSSGQEVYWYSSYLDNFYRWNSYNDTGYYGYYLIDEVVNFSESIYSGSDWRNNGLKVLSYFDSNSNLVLIPNASTTYGLGSEGGYINGYATDSLYYSSYSSIDLEKLNFEGSIWGEDLGIINKNQIKSVNGNVSSNGYKFHKFDCYKKSYLHFTLNGFLKDLDFELFKYNNEMQEWETIFNAETDSDNTEYFFKILDPNSYIIAVTNYHNNFNQSYKLEVDTQTFHESTLLPNDARFDEQWSLLNYGQGDGFDDSDIFAPEAWKIRSTSPNVVVAVVDSGIDYNHEDLVNNIWKNPYEIANNGIDDDLNGYVDDYLGWDFYNNDNNPHPHSYSNIHGTHVAGLIGAEGNNGKGIAGVSWDIKLMNLKVFSDYKLVKNAYTSDTWDAIKYAADNGADIINLSLGIDIGRKIIDGGYYYSGSFNDFKNLLPAFYDGWYSTLKYASDKGCLIIAAAGNDYSSNDNFTCIPADFASEIPGMISVAAASNKGRISSYSNYGNIISIAAPGGDYNSGSSSQILSTAPFNRYESISGTSMAAPIVSGAAALLIAENSSLSNIDLKKILMNSSSKYKWLSEKVESGFLDLYEAITIAKTYEANIAPTNWQLSQTKFDENIPAGSIIATLSAVDENQSDTHTFTLVDGYIESSDNKFFTIDGNQLKIISSPDYETKSSYSIVLKTTDQGGLSSPDLYIELSVNDINENVQNDSNSSSATSKELQQLYVAYFSRPSDHVGLEYWLEKGISRSDFASNMYLQPEFQDVNGGLSTEKQVNQIYLNLFNRNADATGLTYWISQIEKGSLQLASIANDLIWAAENNSDSSNDSTTLANKTNAAVAYTAKIKTSNFLILAYQAQSMNPWITGANLKEAKNFMSGIDQNTTYTSESIDESVAKFISLSPSNDFSLLTDLSPKTIDNITGLNTDNASFFRLYDAAFNRWPDADGLSYWKDNYCSEESDFLDVASSFLLSNEFNKRFVDNVSNAQYVQNLYTNVLGRDYDQNGYDYWLGNLNNGIETRYELLLGFAESVENQTLFTEITGLI
tara:strand:+ start:3828 stop:7028 length:3201 start_codon:yes stop_codon:yes gene_type:complete